jgi:hypothetical protein
VFGKHCGTSMVTQSTTKKRRERERERERGFESLTVPKTDFFVVMISPVLIDNIKYGTYILWCGTNLVFIPMIYFLSK